MHSMPNISGECMTGVECDNMYVEVCYTHAYSICIGPFLVALVYIRRIDELV